MNNPKNPVTFDSRYKHLLNGTDNHLWIKVDEFPADWFDATGLLTNLPYPFLPQVKEYLLETLKLDPDYVQNVKEVFSLSKQPGGNQGIPGRIKITFGAIEQDLNDVRYAEITTNRITVCDRRGATLETFDKRVVDNQVTWLLRGQQLWVQLPAPPDSYPATMSGLYGQIEKKCTALHALFVTGYHVAKENTTPAEEDKWAVKFEEMKTEPLARAWDHPQEVSRVLASLILLHKVRLPAGVSPRGSSVRTLLRSYKQGVPYRYHDSDPVGVTDLELYRHVCQQEVYLSDALKEPAAVNWAHYYELFNRAQTLVYQCKARLEFLAQQYSLDDTQTSLYD